MVKDIIREIKDKKLQFFAIFLITALGVGFFIGIRVTGYNMRLTADTYMEETQSSDLEVVHTLGIDGDMIKDLNEFLGVKGKPINKTEAYVLTKNIDEVMSIYQYDEHTSNDLTLIEGKLPRQKNEAVLDDFMSELYNIPVGSKIKIKKNEVFKEETVTIVGLVKSNLYMNASRGKTSLGTGSIAGYMYVEGLELVNDGLYSAVRYKFSEDQSIEAIQKRIEKKSNDIIEARFKRAIAPAKKELKENEETFQKEKAQVEKELASSRQQLEQAQVQLTEAESSLRAGIRELAFGVPLSGTLEEQLELIEFGFEKVESLAEEAITATKEALQLIEDEELRKPLEVKLEQQEADLASDREKFNNGFLQVKRGVMNYRQGEAELARSKQALESAEQQAQEEFIQAENKINQAKKDLENADQGQLLSFSRKDTIIGYQEFYNDSERIEAIGKVFPLIFFGVAILVTLSTVSRMIDESRLQIGVYKALGYTWFQASLKYVGFSGLAWFFGSVLGILMGFYFYPNIIYDAYRIMYTTPDMITGIVWEYVYLPLCISFLSSVGVAFVKAKQVSQESAANLLRPPMPKAGQRIFLERITPIWQRLSFLYKVSLRNLFRNKARFLMTIVGIGGCCGLLITGFGLKHSIYSIVDNTFDHIIQYDGMMIYQEDADLSDQYMDEYLDIRTDNLQVDHEDVVMYSAEDLEELNNFIQLNDYQTREPIDLIDDPVLISQKLASNNDLEIGDTLEVELDHKRYSVTVDGIVENYVEHFIYMSEDSYQDIFERSESSNTRVFNYTVADDVVSESILSNESVYTVNLLSDLETMFDDMLGNFDIIIYVVVGAAFALELIVLLNLISMNMSEREKELATLKVLGFYPKELAQYILRENIILTLISLVFGLFFGKFLHYFVVSTAELDMILFNKELLIQDIALAMFVTFAISIIINLLMASKANKVNMSEALKTFDD